MRIQYQLRQTVIVTRKEQATGNPTQEQLSLFGRHTFFFGEIVAMRNQDKLYIRRLNPLSLSHNTAQINIQWINVNDTNYKVAVAIL